MDDKCNAIYSLPRNVLHIFLTTDLPWVVQTNFKIIIINFCFLVSYQFWKVIWIADASQPRTTVGHNPRDPNVGNNT